MKNFLVAVVGFLLKHLGVGPLVGIFVGLFYALGLSFIALIIDGYTDGRAFEELGVSLAQAVAVYFVGGFLGGAVAGIFWRVGKSLVGAALLGLVSYLPFSLAAGVALDASNIFESDWLKISLVHAALIGCPLGVYVRRLVKRNPLPDIAKDAAAD